MQYKNVCPKCGQIYEQERDSCPLCGTPAPEPAMAAAPRRRISDKERRERRIEQARQEREARRIQQPTYDNRLTPETSQEYDGQRTEQYGDRRTVPTQQEYDVRSAPSQSNRAQRIAQEQYLQEIERREREQREATRGRIPRSCLIFSAILLITALLISGSFLLWKAGIINLGLYSSLMPKAEPETTATATAAVTDCESIQLDRTSLTFDAEGATQQLTATAVPASSVGAFTFTTGNAAVATVNANGLVTAVGEGETEITVFMGNASSICTVSCSFTEPESSGVLTSGDNPELNNYDMTFFNAGEAFTLKITNGSADAPVTWSVEDEAVATVDEDGTVIAVANGTTTVTAVIGDMSVECIVRCNFDS